MSLDDMSKVPGSDDPTEEFNWADVNEQIKKINEEWDNRSQPDPWNDPISGKHKCYCTMETIMREGCNCGGN